MASLPPRRIDGVAALDAERGGVDRDVGPALVDHEDHAERNAHLADFQAVGPPARGDDLADRVGQGGDVAQGLGHLLDPLGFERQAVDRRRLRAPAGGGLGEVRGVGREDFSGASSSRGCGAKQPGVASRTGGNGQTARGSLACFGQVAAEARSRRARTTQDVSRVPVSLVLMAILPACDAVQT